MGFVSRFRLRIFLRNLGHFAASSWAWRLRRCYCSLTWRLYHDDALRGEPERRAWSPSASTLKAPLELEGTAEEREQWSHSTACSRLTARSSPPPRMPMTSLTTRPMRRRRQPMLRPHLRLPSLTAAQDALAKVRDKKDALYARLDYLADALATTVTRLSALIDKASKSTLTTTISTRSIRPTTAPAQSRRPRNTPFTSCNTTAAMVMARRRFPSTAFNPISAIGKTSTSAMDASSLAAVCSISLAGARAQKVTLGDKYEGEYYSLEYAARTVLGLQFGHEYLYEYGRL